MINSPRIPDSRAPLLKLRNLTGALIVQANSDYFLKQLIVGNAGVCSRIGKILVLSDLGVRISFEQVELPFFGHPVIQARITAEEKIAVDSL